MSNARIGGIADEMFGASDLKAALAKLRRSVCKAAPDEFMGNPPAVPADCKSLTVPGLAVFLPLFRASGEEGRLSRRSFVTKAEAEEALSSADRAQG